MDSSTNGKSKIPIILNINRTPKKNNQNHITNYFSNNSENNSPSRNTEILNNISEKLEKMRGILSAANGITPLKSVSKNPNFEKDNGNVKKVGNEFEVTEKIEIMDDQTITEEISEIPNDGEELNSTSKQLIHNNESLKHNSNEEVLLSNESSNSIGQNEELNEIAIIENSHQQDDSNNDIENIAKHIAAIGNDRLSIEENKSESSKQYFDDSHFVNENMKLVIEPVSNDDDDEDDNEIDIQQKHNIDNMEIDGEEIRNNNEGINDDEEDINNDKENINNNEEIINDNKEESINNDDEEIINNNGENMHGDEEDTDNVKENKNNDEENESDEENMKDEEKEENINDEEENIYEEENDNNEAKVKIHDVTKLDNDEAGVQNEIENNNKDHIISKTVVSKNDTKNIITMQNNDILSEDSINVDANDHSNSDLYDLDGTIKNHVRIISVDLSTNHQLLTEENNTIHNEIDSNNDEGGEGIDYYK